jgi:GNAT superfamily N-acetyltransferase
MSTLRIDVAGTGDLAELVRLLGAQLAEHDIPATDAGMERAVRGMLEDPRRGTLFLARQEAQRAVGMACLSYTWTLELGGLSAWLDELYVEPALRGAGVGRALLTAAITHARSVGAAAVDLEVVEGHERAARLYEREGFTRRFRTRWALTL